MAGLGGMLSALHADRVARSEADGLRERLALAIHQVVCADGPCVPHQNDWLAVADQTLATIEAQRQAAQA